jgi:hypothetical protein
MIRPGYEVSNSSPSKMARLPVPAINPGLIIYKLCEVLLEPGLTHSKRAFPPPEIAEGREIFTRLAPANPRRS